MEKIRIILPMGLSVNDMYTMRYDSKKKIFMKFPCAEAEDYFKRVQNILIGEGFDVDNYVFKEEDILRVTCHFFFSHNLSKTDNDNWRKCAMDSLFWTWRKVVKRKGVKVEVIFPTVKLFKDDKQIFADPSYKYFKKDHGYENGFIDLTIEVIEKPIPNIDHDLVSYFMNKYPNEFKQVRKARK